MGIRIFCIGNLYSNQMGGVNPYAEFRRVRDEIK